MATTAELIVDIIVLFIVLLIVAAVLKGLSKGIIKNKYSGGFGRAFFVALVGLGTWYIIFTYMVTYLEIVLSTPVALAIGLVTIWLAYAGIIKVFYHTSFGRGMGVAILLAIVTVLLFWLTRTLLYLTILPLLILAGIV
jgi:hypothetical protein